MKILTDATLALIFGGALSVICQLLIDKTSLTPAKILVSFVLFGVFLGAIRLYDPLIELFGCGATVPLSGYGANIAKGVREAINEKGALGIITGAFSASAAGCTAALISGFLASLFCRGKRKSI